MAEQEEDRQDHPKDYEFQQDRMDQQYRHAWERAPKGFVERAKLAGIKPQLDGVSKALPLNEVVENVSYTPDMGELDTEIDRLVEQFGGQNEHIIQAVVLRLREPMEKEIERQRAAMLGRIACYLIKTESRNILAHIHALLHAIPRLAAIAGFRSMRASAEACGCSPTLVMNGRNKWCETLGLPVPEEGRKSEEDKEKYRLNAETNHWRRRIFQTEPTLCKPIPNQTPNQKPQPEQEPRLITRLKRRPKAATL